MIHGTNPDWMDKYRMGSNYIPGQMEIEYFWPLTEQIPLDLDYTGCERPKVITGQQVTFGTGATSWATTNCIRTAQLVVTEDGIETPEITFTLNEKPGIIRRLAYKFLGIKWKTK